MDHLRLHVTEAGCGPPLVLLHGFTGSAAQWSPHVGVFGRAFRTLSIDLPGHGKSAAPGDPRRYAMRHCIADLAAALDRAGVERAAWLGYSMGGRTALAFALARPERVNALVLEAASPGIADPEERRARRERDAALARSIETAGIESFVDEWMGQPLFASQARLGPAALAACRAARLANDPTGLANSLRGLGTGSQPPMWDQLPQLSAPTLLVVGEEDRKFHDIAVAMARQMPNTSLAVISQAGHATHLENPGQFQTRVMEFLSAGFHKSGDASSWVSSPGWED